MFHFKLKLALYQAYKKIETKEHHLDYLFLELTQRCNLSCLHCGSDCKASVGKAELTTQSWLKIIDFVYDNFGKSVAFVITGGEPLMHQDLDKLGQYITSKGMRWGMVTNGILLTQERFDSLRAAGLYSMTISIDGLEDSHNFLRNSPRAFERVEKALRILGKSDLKFRDAVTCVSPKNLYELDAVANKLLTFGLNSWRLFRIFPSGRAKNNAELTLSFEQTQEMLHWIAKNKKKLDSRALNTNLSCEGYLPFSQDIKVRDQAFFCRAGINIASILSNGNITGCTNNHESFHVGNILKDNFRFVWEHRFEIFRKREWLQSTICKQCDEFKNCRGASVHLWELPADKPKFCYAKNLERN